MDGGGSGGGGRRAVPVEAFCQALALDRRGLEDLPLAAFERRQAQALRNLSHGHGVVEVLLVGKHQERRVLELLLLEAPAPRVAVPAPRISMGPAAAAPRGRAGRRWRTSSMATSSSFEMASRSRSVLSTT